MNPLVKKEIRLLLPAWVAAMVLAVVPFTATIVWIRSTPQNNFFEVGDNGPVPFYAPLIFALGVLFLGISSFGPEMSSGTFAVLLSQPIERGRVWLVKIATLTAAFVLVWLTAVVLLYWQFDVLESMPLRIGGMEDFKSGDLEFLTLSTLVAFSGGLWTTLLLRQTSTAFWISLLAPVAIIIGMASMMSHWIAAGKSINTIIVVALVSYSIAGFFCARRLFFRAQDAKDIRWTSGEIACPRLRKILKTQTVSIPDRPRHWLSALVWKEIQLHQATLIIAAIVLVLNLSCVVILKVHPDFENDELGPLLKGVWIVWLLVPVLIGTTAIAEERRSGVIESQLCLPVSCRTQWLVKFCVSSILGLFLGGMMPWIIEGPQILSYWIFAVAAWTFFISIYVSSLARTALQSVGFGIVMAAAIYFFQIGPMGWDGLRWRWHNLLYYETYERYGIYLNLSLLMPVLIWLAFWNFKSFHAGRKFWLVNLITICGAFKLIPILDNVIVPFIARLVGHNYL